MNDEAVCRTAPATPGLLIILTKILSLARCVTDSDISLKSKLTERIFFLYIIKPVLLLQKYPPVN